MPWKGVVDPRRPSELWVYLMSILFGAALYANFVASLTAVFTEVGASGREYRSKIDMLHKFMTSLRMPYTLRAKLQAYFELCLVSEKGGCFGKSNGHQACVVLLDLSTFESPFGKRRGI